MRAKKHVTIRLTEDKLRGYGMCESGLAAHRHLLPAKISTDPEQNIELALEIADSPRAVKPLGDVAYLWYNVGDQNLSDMEPSCTSDGYDALAGKGPRNGEPNADAYVVAQQLGAIADRIATKQGK